MFEIIAGSFNNTSWVKAWLTSLEKTLHNTNRLITIYDSSTIDEEEKELRNICSKTPLNIMIIKWDENIALAQTGSKVTDIRGYTVDAARRASSEYVCHIDVDAIFILPNWDLYIEEKLSEGFKLIGCSIRHKSTAETCFFVTVPKLIIESKLAHTLTMRRANKWDDNILSIDHGGEHAYMTYLAIKWQYKIKLFEQKIPRKQNQWGDIVLKNGKEFFYHNYYSARVQPGNKCLPTAHEIKFVPSANLPNVEYHAQIMQLYIDEIWPNSLDEFLKTPLPLKSPSILQIELTKNCNNACIMCHKGQIALGKNFNRSDISDIVLEQIRPLYPYLKHAMLFGDGEPMLYKRFWNVVADIRNASPECAIDFINNGSQMNRLNADKCFEYQVSHVGLSLGGATPETHNKIRKFSNLNQIIKNFAYLRDQKEKLNTKEPYVQILIVVMKSNIHELPNFIRLAHKLGAYKVVLQKLFVTHLMMKTEVVSEKEEQIIFEECAKISSQLGIGLDHYLNNVQHVNPNASKINPDDRIFRSRYDPTIQPNGYCKFQQPWNSIYVLYSGKVVPDCHWWYSKTKPELNTCGTLDKNTNILEIWNGAIYQKIRESIEHGNILPQCRGCGLAGGIKDEYRSEETDHNAPDNKKLVQLALPKIDVLQQIADKSDTKEQKEIYRQICETLRPNIKSNQYPV